MDKQALISEMHKFHFGNKIFCTDGQAGTLTHVLCEASTKRLTQLALKQNRLFGKTFYLPFQAVTRATGEGIWLNVTLAELATAPGSPEAGVLLDTHTSVRGGSADGTLLMVAAQPGNGKLAYIVVHDLTAGRDTLLSEQYITALTPGQMLTTITAQMLDTLPPYRSDRELQQEVEEIIFDLAFLHIDLKGMHLHVLDGVLYMEGNISSNLRGELARDQVGGVAGLLEVKNNLVGDDTLAGDIALALGQDERTHDLPLGVYPQLGVVRLSGSTHNEQQKAVAGEIAKTFAGVRGVINDLVVDPAADMLYVMSAPEGGEARDITPGKFTRHTK
ncbi:MAG TPA: BON domain-containing protein [Ktedonobacteraceae bacterium]